MALKLYIASIEEKNKIYNALIEYSKELGQFQENPIREPASEKYFDDYWTESQRFPIVAYNDNELIGFCLLRSEEAYYSIAEFYIKPKFRRLGHGTKLLNFTLEFCKKRGLHTTICANSLEKNVRANEFWIFNGFVRLKEVVLENERFHCNLKELI